MQRLWLLDTLGLREDRIESVVKHIIILTQVLLVIPILIIGLGFSENVMKFIGAQQDTLHWEIIL